MPYAQDTHIDQALTNLSIAYSQTGMVGDRVIPTAPVDKRSDRYFIYGKEAFKRRDDLVRPGSTAMEITRTLSTDLYLAERHAERTLVTDAERRVSDAPLDADADAVELITGSVMNQREFAILATVTDPTVVTQNLTLSGTTQWSDYVNSVPLSNLRTAKTTVRAGVLKEATSLTISYDGGQVLADHPSIKDLIKYTSPGNIGTSGLPNVIRGLQVNEAGAFIDNTNDGQTPAFSTAWGANALVHYTNPTPGRKTISFGYLFESPDDTTGVRGFAVERYRDTPRHGDWIEVSTTYAIKIVAPLGGYLFITIY